MSRRPATTPTSPVLWTIAALTLAPVGVQAEQGPQKASPADARGGGDDDHRSHKRWRPEPPPPTADDARDPRVEEAMREAPPLPPRARRYRGPNKAYAAARAISKTVPSFINFRATIPGATWRDHPAHRWRVRPEHRCLAELRRQKLRFRRPSPPDEGEEPLDVGPTPTPVELRGTIAGVRFRSGRGGPLLISCELAARLRTMAEILSRHGVDQVIVISAYRPRPRTSFHTMGMALDIMRFHLEDPAVGPDGERSPWLNVLTDFVETPDQETCAPELLAEDSPLGGNERGRRLLAIACDLHASGVFASVLTPNYNPGHRDHFHIDIRPDDPRVFLR